MKRLAYKGSFFQSEDWFFTLQWATGITPKIIGDADGALPCKVGKGRLESLTNFYSVEYRPVGHWERFIPETGPHVALQFLRDDNIERVFQDSGYRTFRNPQFANWTATIDGGFANYFKARPSQLRSTVKRKSKAIASQLEIRIFTEPNAADYNAVYRDSWKNEEPYPRFIPTLMEAAEALGILRLGIAYLEGEPAAAQIWIVENGRAVIYKLAYKEKFKTLSVGTVLSHEMFRHAIDVDGVQLIDYGVGDEPYKRDWMTHRGEVYQLTCLDRSVKGRVLASLMQTWRWAKQRHSG